ncbi:MAG: thymidylate kinase [Pseudonocardia sp.]|nr:thymidylate kinase [Pseudonocardia sp.]
MTIEASTPHADAGPPAPAPRGALVSIEGVSGVGKTYLTGCLLAAVPADQRPLVVEEFSQRRVATDPSGALGRQLLGALVDAAPGDPFLRGGQPRSETLLLIAVKIHDFESVRPALMDGRTVIEGRSAHSTAVYQSLILEPGDDRATTLAHQILETTARWRPLPDLTVLITDDLDIAIRRAETRDGSTYTPEHWRIHRRAARLFGHLAADDPDHIRVLDRRDHTTAALVDILSAWTVDPPRRTWQQFDAGLTSPDAAAPERP